MSLAELFEFKTEVEELRKRYEKSREIRRKLDEVDRLVGLCLHYRTGTTCRLAIEELRKLAKELEKEVFPYGLP